MCLQPQLLAVLSSLLCACALLAAPSHDALWAGAAEQLQPNVPRGVECQRVVPSRRGGDVDPVLVAGLEPGVLQPRASPVSVCSCRMRVQLINATVM